ncbi:protein of unassigned function [Methylobacterium oryzae CBMB20]|uniref:Protein of unassigned function n=1 Tax=Methylobacterium oryzae CBMB20 TaxID=693986 RepID=A0A089NNI1_9HYPH|nr:protein of unassigned function [Methylobacterium oryzae CBMB20]
MIIAVETDGPEFLCGICAGARRFLPESGPMPLDGLPPPRGNCGFLVVEFASRQAVQRFNLGVLGAGIG